MKSPFTGNEAYREVEERTLEFRKESFRVLYNFYVCEDTGEQFTTTELDTANLNQVHNQYREKYGIPFTEEIRALKNHYGLSSTKMSEVLGFGANVYRQYEAGEMPSIANGRLIQLAKDPFEFKKCLMLSQNALDKQEFDRVYKKIEHSMAGYDKMEEMYEQKILGPKQPTAYTGYTVPSIEKVGCLVQYFAQKFKPYKTKLNKLLFYTDFLHYRNTSFGVTGLTYKAIQHGPVPNNYSSLYDDVIGKKYADVQLVDLGDYDGEQFYIDSKLVYNKSEGVLSESEIKTMEEVAARFASYNTKNIVDASHEEYAWQLNVDQYNRIKYDFGFYLKTV